MSAHRGDVFGAAPSQQSDLNKIEIFPCELWICKNSFYIPTLENEFTGQQSHMGRPISGKSVKISGMMHGHTVSEEMDPKAEGKVWQLEEVQTLIMRPSVLIIYSHPHRTAANDSKKPPEESVNCPVK